MAAVCGHGSRSSGAITPPCCSTCAGFSVQSNIPISAPCCVEADAKRQATAQQGADAVVSAGAQERSPPRAAPPDRPAACGGPGRRWPAARRRRWRARRPGRRRSGLMRSPRSCTTSVGTRMRAPTACGSNCGISTPSRASIAPLHARARGLRQAEHLGEAARVVARRGRRRQQHQPLDRQAAAGGIGGRVGAQRMGDQRAQRVALLLQPGRDVVDGARELRQVAHAAGAAAVRRQLQQHRPQAFGRQRVGQRAAVWPRMAAPAVHQQHRRAHAASAALRVAR